MNDEEENLLKETVLILVRRIDTIEKVLDKLNTDLDNFLNYDTSKFKDRRRPGLV